MAEISPVAGCVYILSNPSMPGLVKIGSTTRPVEERVQELGLATGVPRPFALEGAFPSEEAGADESAVHLQLASFRLPSREFFELPVDAALDRVEVTLGRPPFFVRGATEIFNAASELISRLAELDEQRKLNGDEQSRAGQLRHSYKLAVSESALAARRWVRACEDFLSAVRQRRSQMHLD